MEGEFFARQQAVLVGLPVAWGDEDGVVVAFEGVGALSHAGQAFGGVVGVAVQPGERRGEVVIQAEAGEFVLVEVVELVGLVHRGLVNVELFLGDRGPDLGGEALLLDLFGLLLGEEKLLVPFLLPPLQCGFQAGGCRDSVQYASQ